MLYTFSDTDFTLAEFDDLVSGYVEDEVRQSILKSASDALHVMVERGALVAPHRSSVSTSDGKDDEGTSCKPTHAFPGIPPLTHLYLYVTFDCNEHCYHCYQRNAGAVTPRALQSSTNMSLHDLMSLVEKAESLGLQAVKITGGEPFLYRHIDALITSLAARGIRLSVETNGTAITARRAALLAENDVDVSVSLDGSTPERHDALRGLRGAYRMAMRGIRHLSEAGVRVKIITAVSKRNLDDLPDICQVAAAVDARLLKINPINELGIAGESPYSSTFLTAMEIRDLYARIIAERWEEPFGVELFFEGPPALFPLDRIAKGQCGTCPFLNILGVLSDGTVSFCGIGFSEEDLQFGNAATMDLVLWPLVITWFGQVVCGAGRPQRWWRSLRTRARSRRCAASTSGSRGWALRQRR